MVFRRICLTVAVFVIFAVSVTRKRAYENLKAVRLDLGKSGPGPARVRSKSLDPT